MTSAIDAVPVPATPRRIAVLGTGGTISGRATQVCDNVGYRAGEIGVADLVAHPGLAEALGSTMALEFEQVAQLDSKDMSHSAWRRLAERCAAHLGRAEVDGIVITHGTDTLEETAYLLQRVLAPAKPVVLTAAMRPATALQPDGPQNLLDALTLAALPGAQGVLVALAGAVWAGTEVRKTHPYRFEAFGAGDAGPLAWVEEGRVRTSRPWPAGSALGVEVLAPEVWPGVEILVSHGGQDGALAQLLVESGVQGLVVACTGNGTVHEALQAVLLQARRRGVAVLRALRQGGGSIIDTPHDTLPHAGSLTAAQARVELLLQLLARR